MRQTCGTAKWDDVIIKVVPLLLSEVKIIGMTFISPFSNNGFFLASRVNWWDTGLETENVRTAAVNPITQREIMRILRQTCVLQITSKLQVQISVPNSPQYNLRFSVFFFVLSTAHIFKLQSRIYLRL